MVDENLEIPFIRLAFRTEDDWVVCYMADPNNMKEALELARIRKSVLHATNSKGFEQYKALMVALFSNVLKESIGAELEFWTEHPAKRDVSN